MELTVGNVVLFVSIIACTINKTFGCKNKKLIPFQNLLIGVIAGIISYYSSLDINLLDSIIVSVVAAFSSEGVCNFITINKDKGDVKK